MPINLVPGNTRLTADGAVGTSGNIIRVFSVHLVSGGTASEGTLRNGTSASDTALAQIDGTADAGVTLSFSGGLKFVGGCFYDADANIDYVTIIYTEESG